MKPILYLMRGWIKYVDKKNFKDLVDIDIDEVEKERIIPVVKIEEGIEDPDGVNDTRTQQDKEDDYILSKSKMSFINLINRSVLFKAIFSNSKDSVVCEPDTCSSNNIKEP